MEIKIIKKKDLSTSRWSGGTTTQLAICPTGVDYSNRTFLWRLSSAVVEIESSDFTPLSGFNRVIMSLNGDLHLKHNGHHEILLSPYVADHFSGVWETSSIGKVTDFNLMVRDGMYADLIHLPIQDVLSYKIGTSAKTKSPYLNYTHTDVMDYEVRVDAFFSVEDKYMVTIQGQNYKVDAGDLLLLSYSNDAFKAKDGQLNIKIEGKQTKSANLIHAIIGYDSFEE